MYGDSSSTRKRVAQLREQGDDIRAAADQLVNKAESVPWRGRAADAMRARIKERANELRQAAEQHDAAADSLARHNGEIDVRKEAISSTEQRIGALTADARTRVAELPEGQEPSREDSLLTTFTAPPAGHKDWLSVELPGL